MPSSAKKLIDVLDEMNMKEADFLEEVIKKLDRLAKLIFDTEGTCANLIFVKFIW